MARCSLRASTYAMVLLTALASSDHAFAGLGVAMHGEPKYKEGFTHFDYANPNAPKGGSLVLGNESTFDTLNPFTMKDVSAPHLESLVFQQLGEQPLDEPFTSYPGLAESFTIAEDKLSMTVNLHKEARFSDGSPVTAEDVEFSFQTLIGNKAQPFYRSYYADVKEVKPAGKHTVKISFKQLNPELPLIALQLPVLPKHFYGKGDFATAFRDKVLGSGPYVVKAAKPGSSIVYARNPDFWGKDLPINKGRYNFDELMVKFYKDTTAMVEAFKKGEFDVFVVNSAKTWANELEGERFGKLKWIKKALLDNQNNQGAQIFSFNLRLPQFQDIRVRKAIALAFDWEWSNKNLFFGQYTRSGSYFENSPLKAVGLPTPEEKAVLEPLMADLNPETLTKEMAWLGKGQDFKENLKQALGLLKEAGYAVKNGVATGPAGKLEFKVLLMSPAMARVFEPYAQNLRKLGIVISLDQKEASVYAKRVETRDFDIISRVIAQSLSPGNEQRAMWGTKAADETSSYNYGGLKNKAIDALVEKIVYAKSRAELELYTKCLDRALYHLHIGVHNWYSNAHRVAFWDKFGMPAKLPSFYYPTQLFEFMWVDAARAARLDEAKAQGKPLL